MLSEADFKKKVMKRLKTLDEMWCVSINLVAISGVPDIIGCSRGRFFAIECKKDATSRVTALQKYTLEYIRKAGGLAFIWHPGNWEAMFKDFFDGAPKEQVRFGQIRSFRKGK